MSCCQCQQNETNDCASCSCGCSCGCSGSCSSGCSCGCSGPRNGEPVCDRSITGLVLGIIGFTACWIPLLGFPISLCGLFYSMKSLRASENSHAVTSLILNVICLCLTIISNFVCGMILGSLMTM